jgi:tetratricopeptide (TPR) repeat protein
LGQEFQLFSLWLAGRAHLGAGDLEAAREQLAAQAAVSHRLDEDSRHRWFHRNLEGDIALAAGDLDAAEAAFLAAEPERKAHFTPTQFGLSVFFNNVGTDGLARVKRARGDLEDALEIYRNLNTPGLEAKFTALFEPRYVLESARLLDQMGQKESAREEYRGFVEFWKDGDPGRPEVGEAEAYLAR